MCSLRSGGPHDFIPNTVKTKKGFHYISINIARTAHSAALCVIR